MDGSKGRRGMGKRLTYANVMATIAALLALSGGSFAVASHLNVRSSDIVRNAVKSRHIANGKVKGVDTNKSEVQARVGQSCDPGLSIRAISESGSVTCETVGGGGAPTGPAGGDLTGSYPNPLIAGSAITSATVADDSLTGADIAEATLGQVPSALMGGIGRRARPGTLCDPGSEAFHTCAFTTIDLPVATHVLVIGTVKAQSEGTNGTGQCLLATHLSNIGNTISGFEAGVGPFAKFVPLITVTTAGPGPIDFAIRCNELGPEIQYFDATITAVALSPS